MFINVQTVLFQAKVQSETAMNMVYLEICETIPSVLMAMTLGSLSDVKGRKLALILPLFGSTLMNFIFVIIAFADWPLAFGLIGAFINGITGSVALAMTGAISYLADVSTPENKILRMAILQIVGSLGRTVSQICIGYIIGKLGFVPAFLFLIACNLVNILYVIFLVPETIKEQKDLTEMKNPLRRLQKGLKTIVVPTIIENKWSLWLILIVNTIITLANMGGFRLSTLFAMNSPLCWNSVLLGYYGAFDAITGNISRLLLAAFVVPRISDVGGIMLSLISQGASMVVHSVAVHTWIMFMGK